MTSAIGPVRFIHDANEGIIGWEEPTSADPIRPDGVQVEIVGSVRSQFEIFQVEREMKPDISGGSCEGRGCRLQTEH